MWNNIDECLGWRKVCFVYKGFLYLINFNLLFDVCLAVKFNYP